MRCLQGWFWFYSVRRVSLRRKLLRKLIRCWRTLLLQVPRFTSPSEARGVLRAQDQAVLASELAGRIVDLPAREGETFKKGDTLARFDCSAYQAQLNASQAASRGASEELAHNRQLAALNSVGRFEVARAEAGLLKLRRNQVSSGSGQTLQRCSAL